MSKETLAGPLKFLRYPVADTTMREEMGLDKDTGHNVPRPRRGKTARDHRSGAWANRLSNLAARKES